MNAPADVRQLPTSHRSVRLENRSALLRRWHLVQGGQLEDPRIEQLLFPGQRDLLQLLEVLTAAEVEILADCGAPLFTIPLRGTDVTGDASLADVASGSLEAATRHETFLALSARLDAIRTSFTQGCLLFHLSPAQASWLSRLCPLELDLLAADTSMVLTPAVDPAYFIAAATRHFNGAERTVLGAIARGHASSGRWQI